GEIVGSSSTKSDGGHAFFRTADGRMLDIGDFSAEDVNAAGQVVGFRVVPSPAGNVAYAVFWSASTGIIELGEGVARSINDLGQIVGSASGSAGVAGAAFWPSAHESPVGLGGSDAQGINNDGVVIGYRNDGGAQVPVRWRNVAGMWVMEDLSASRYTSAFRINIHGDGTGGGCPALDDGGCLESHAFLWPASGGEIRLASLGGSRRHGYGINDNRDVVGFATNSGGKQRAVIWPAGGGVADLGLIRGAAQGEARDINSRGVIVGENWLNSGRDRAVMWTPR
ncbi:MAG: hypothetical protein ABR499_02370, partial [Gemmatimonadaceae bacterium]